MDMNNTIQMIKALKDAGFTPKQIMERLGADDDVLDAINHVFHGSKLPTEMAEDKSTKVEKSQPIKPKRYISTELEGKFLNLLPDNISELVDKALIHKLLKIDPPKQELERLSVFAVIINILYNTGTDMEKITEKTGLSANEVKLLVDLGDQTFPTQNGLKPAWVLACEKFDNENPDDVIEFFTKMINKNKDKDDIDTSKMHCSKYNLTETGIPFNKCDDCDKKDTCYVNKVRQNALSDDEVIQMLGKDYRHAAKLAQSGADGDQIEIATGIPGMILGRLGLCDLEPKEYIIPMSFDHYIFAKVIAPTAGEALRQVYANIPEILDELKSKYGLLTVKKDDVRTPELDEDGMASVSEASRVYRTKQRATDTGEVLLPEKDVSPIKINSIMQMTDKPEDFNVDLVPVEDGIAVIIGKKINDNEPS